MVSQVMPFILSVPGADERRKRTPPGPVENRRDVNFGDHSRLQTRDLVAPIS
jgi:hypothetical protein